MEEVEQKLEQTKLLVEIHDAMVATVPLHEEDMYDSIVYRNCTKKVVDKWPWIVVPLVMEKERSEVDGNWAEMTSCGVLHD
jgi:DNA polymerase I-like protein with 3'-5' exonuclease and polymerase domains